MSARAITRTVGVSLAAGLLSTSVLLAADSGGPSNALPAAAVSIKAAPAHGESGKGGHAEGAVLSDNIAAETVMAVATTGRKEMPPFGQSLSEKELRDVAAYISRLLAK